MSIQKELYLKDLENIQVGELKELVVNGRNCAIYRAKDGHLNGYAYWGNKNPLTEEEAFDLDFLVHGGVTYFGALPNRNGNYIGFDCNHYRDWTIDYSLDYMFNDCTYKDYNFVKNELAILVEEINTYQGAD